jgi:hypothetical protein
MHEFVISFNWVRLQQKERKKERERERESTAKVVSF